MLRRVARFLIPPVAALLLLAALTVGLEYWLQGRSASTSIITAQTELAVQPLLESSSTCHHRLRPGARKRLALSDTASVTVRINSAGLRGPEPSVEAQMPWRILMLGDDTVFGAELSERQSLPGQLQQLIQSRTESAVEVLNGGVPGDCPLLTMLRFPDFRQLQPKLVILHLDMSDVDDDTVYRSLFGETNEGPACLHPSLRSANPGPALPLPGWLQESAVFRHGFAALRHDVPSLLSITSEAAGQQQFTWISDHGENRRLETEHALRPLAELRRAVEASGAKLLVTTCPVAWQLVDGRRIPELTRRCRIRGATPCAGREPFLAIAEFCARERIRLVDVSDRFRQQEEPLELFSRTSPVLSAKGVTLYAAAISEYLFKNPPGDWETSENAEEPR
ncbi:MAG: hypothetical protein ACKO2L_05500 [Planctomycetaceae bacterium]